MPSALVFAGSSFIGRHLGAALREANIPTIATAHRAGQPGAIACDLTNEAEVERVVRRENFDYIFQCAGATTSRDPREMYAVHVSGCLNVLHAARTFSPKSLLVFVGSAAEYGSPAEAALPINEDWVAQPSSFFGASKLAQTHAAITAARDWNLRVIVARPFNVTGPGLPGHYFASALAQRLLKAPPDEKKSGFPVMNADATRDLVDVRDVANALLMLATLAPPPPGRGEIYNIASGCEVSVFEVARVLCELNGGKRSPEHGGSSASRSGISRSAGDFAKLHHATRWTPKISWQQSITDTWHSLIPGGAA